MSVRLAGVSRTCHQIPHLRGTKYVRHGGNPDSSQAQAGYTKFTGEYIPEAKDTGSAETEPGKWVMVKREGRYVIIALDAPDEESGGNLIDACMENTGVSKK